MTESSEHCSVYLTGIVERLEAAAAAVEVARVQFEEDRRQISRLIMLTDRLLQSTGRLEETTHQVAEDLSASIGRADAAPDTPGASADAALRSGD